MIAQEKAEIRNIFLNLFSMIHFDHKCRQTPSKNSSKHIYRTLAGLPSMPPNEPASGQWRPRCQPCHPLSAKPQARKSPSYFRPFYARTAGKTLFQWFKEGTEMEEAHFRSSIYMAAACRCFPGKEPKGGDRAPNLQEVKNCSRWFRQELDILNPALVIPVGKLAIQQFLQFDKLTDVIGKKFKVTYEGHSFDIIPLPHPSGASPWHRMEPGKSLIKQALKRIKKHPAFKGIKEN